MSEIEAIKKTLERKYLKKIVEDSEDDGFYLDKNCVIHHRGSPHNLTEKYFWKVRELFQLLAEEKANRWIDEHLKDRK